MKLSFVFYLKGVITCALLSQPVSNLVVKVPIISDRSKTGIVGVRIPLEAWLYIRGFLYSALLCR